MNNIEMLYYDRDDISKGIDVNKTSELKECDICHYWHFLEKRLSISTKFLQWMSFFINDVYEP